MNQSPAEPAAMPKTQKTFYLDDDLILLLEAVQRRSGATFTRQVTAAVLQYLFTRPDGPDPYWMEQAVALDDGELTISALIEDRKESVELEQGFLLELESEGDAKQPGNPTVGLCEVRDHYTEILDRQEKQWAQMLQQPGTDVVKVIRTWSEMRKQARKPQTPQ